MQYKGFDLYTNPDRQVARYGEFQDNITEVFNITKNYSFGSYIYIKLTRIPDRIYSIVAINQDNSEIQLNNNEFNLEENGYIKIVINSQIKAIRVLYSGTGSLVSAEDIWELQSGTLMNENFELRGNAIIDKDLRIKGNLFLEGDISAIDFSQTNELRIKDKLAYLNFGNDFITNTNYGLKVLNNTDDKFGLIFNNDEFSINKYDSGQVIKYASFLSNGINLNINNDTVIKITSDKKVGILNSSPSGILSITTSSGNIHFGGQYPDLWFDGGSDSVFFISNRGASNGRTSITYNNTELFSVLNNGNVGIGDVSPTEKLSVSGNIILNTSQDAFIGTKNNYSLKLRTNNTDRIIITNAGNVGIGTSTITDKLTVNGSISSTSLKTNSIDASTGSGIFNNLTVNTNTNLNGTSTLTGIINLNGDIYRNGQLLHWDNLIFNVETRIGDGTTTDFILNEIPLENSLIVSKNGIILTVGVDYDISFQTVSFYEPPANGSKLRFQYVKYIPSTTNVSQLLLSYNNSWTGQNYFLNKVGIGTTNPTKNLDVSGDVCISGNVDIYIPSLPDSKITIHGGDRILFRSNYRYYKLEFKDNNASPIIQIIAVKDILDSNNSFNIDFNNNKTVRISGDQLSFYTYNNGVPVFNYAYGTYIQLNQPTFLMPGQKGFAHYSSVNQFDININLPHATNRNKLALYRMYVIIITTSTSNMDIRIFPNGVNGDGTFYYTSFNNGGSSNATTSNAFFFDVFNGSTDNYPYILEFLIMSVPDKTGIISMRASGKGAASFGTCVWEANNMIWSSIGKFLSVNSEMGEVYYIIERII
jgi:hypothetical protein